MHHGDVRFLHFANNLRLVLRHHSYAVMSNTRTFKEAASSATKLVRRLLADQRSLFLNPLTWDG